MASPVWTFVLTDLMGSVLGEITNADERQVTLPLNRVPTASFKIPLAHSLAETIMALNQDAMVKAYRYDGTTNKLAFFGPVLTAEEVADRDTQSIAVNAVGPFWRVSKRLLGTTKAGISWGIAGGPIEITQIASNIMETANTADTIDEGGLGLGYTGIQVQAGNVVPNSPTPNNTHVGPFHLKNAAELMAELAASVNSFDFEVVPQEPANSGLTWPTIGQMYIKPYIGVTRPNLIFEYGGQANVVGYSRSNSRDNYVNKAYMTAPGWPDATSLELRIKRDNASIISRGLFEDTAEGADVANDSVRDAILSEHIYHRSHPREVITVNLAQNARPWVFTDWNVGDTVRARATVRGATRFDAMFRIWGATMAIDKNGNETTQLELVMP